MNALAPRRFGLLARIVTGLLAGIALGALVQKGAPLAGWQGGAAQLGQLLGGLFIGALKAVAPVLVLVLVVAALSRPQQAGGNARHIRPILLLYLLGTFLAALVAVTASFLFPSSLTLEGVGAARQAAPGGIGEVLRGLLMKIVANPVQALMDANYIGILAWALLLGVALRHAGETTRQAVADFAAAITRIVGWIIQLAPFGIFGLMLTTLVTEGFDGLDRYLHLLAVLVGCMLFVALVVNPALVFWKTRRNPYPLVFTCLRESGLTAFFTRSSAANIPVNLRLCQKLGLHEDSYSIAIPLGATLNMAGAAITITVLTLAAVHTLGIAVNFHTALLLSIVATLGACGASGVAGGSLLLIPMACALFNIDDGIAMQVVGVGFIIGVVQDSFETALNSSTDVLFTAAAEGARPPA